MPARVPLTLAEKERLAAARLHGRSRATIAAELGCSSQTACKWWRQARDHGRSAVQQSRRGRAATGVVSRFAPAVTARALMRGRAHTIGRSAAGQRVIVQCAAQTHEWVVHQQDGTLVKRLPIRRLDLTALTGITDLSIPAAPPIQRTLSLVA
jgi:transposase-like protein